MDSESSHLCPECGKPVPAESSHQLCPACLMAQALASRTLVDGDDAAVPPPLSPEEIAEKFPQFEITECLGRGGMGSVYKARQKSLNRWVAIKILAPEREGRERFAERFAREAQTLARLSHPHIVTIHDFGQTDGLFYLVMEYVDGVNLRELLRDGKIEPEQALAIVPPICDALQYAHDKGVVHRDIKPENLLLDRDGRVKIADFGIASLIGAENESAGTPAYMAPEQADAKREVDHRADIYALGVVLYEMLTGERPAKEIIAPSRKVQIDVRLDEIVLRALEKNPELRFQEASVFKTRLETIAAKGIEPQEDGQTSEIKRFRTAGTSAPPHVAAPTRLGKWALALLAIALLFGLNGIGRVMISPFALILAFFFGLKSWRTMSGKIATLAAGWVLVLGSAFIIPRYTSRPADSHDFSHHWHESQGQLPNRVLFTFSHNENRKSLVGSQIALAIKPEGDTGWQPANGQAMHLEDGRKVLFKVRITHSEAQGLTGRVITKMEKEPDWQENAQALHPNRTSALDFANGLRVSMAADHSTERADPDVVSLVPLPDKTPPRQSVILSKALPLVWGLGTLLATGVLIAILRSQNRPRGETAADYANLSAPTNFKLKLSRFYESFAAAFSTLAIALVLTGVGTRTHLNAGLYGLIGVPVLALVYAVFRIRPAAKPFLRAGRLFECFSAAFFTLMLLATGFRLTPYVEVRGFGMAGVLAASLIYAFWRDRKAFSAPFVDPQGKRWTVALVKGVLVLLLVAQVIGSTVEIYRQVPKDLGLSPRTSTTLVASPSGTNRFIDFDSGAVLSPPPALAALLNDDDQAWMLTSGKEAPQAYQDWLAQTGVDAVAMPDGLAFFNNACAVGHGEQGTPDAEWPGDRLIHLDAIFPADVFKGADILERAHEKVPRMLNPGAGGLFYYSKDGMVTATRGFPGDRVSAASAAEANRVWIFKTRQGTRGVLTFDPSKIPAPERPIRYRLLESSAVKKTPPTFGPVIKRVIPEPAPGVACVLDFESGLLLTPPDELVEPLAKNAERSTLSDTARAWLRESQGDLSVCLDHPVAVGFLGTAATDYFKPDGQRYTLDNYPADLQKSSFPAATFNSKHFYLHSSLNGTRTAVFFTTLQGTKGIMEIVGPSSEPKGVKVRYKLVRGLAPDAKALAAAKLAWAISEFQDRAGEGKPLQKPDPTQR